jgi:hypothetical protein
MRPAPWTDRDRFSDQALGHANVPEWRPDHGPCRPDDSLGQHAERPRDIHHLQGWEEYRAVVSPGSAFGAGLLAPQPAEQVSRPD